jgi:hypothetical protein
VNQLCPALSQDTWTLGEDQLLLLQQRSCGNSWAHIALSLPGRSPNAVKNRWVWLRKHGTDEDHVIQRRESPMEMAEGKAPERVLFPRLEESVMPFPSLEPKTEAEEARQLFPNIAFVG